MIAFVFVTFASIIVLNTSVLYLYLFLQSRHSFFKNRPFPTLKPNLIFGNFGSVIRMKKPVGLCLYDLHKRLEPHKYAGMYMLHRPAVLIRDPELLKIILTEDFDYFRDRGFEFEEEEEPLMNNLLWMNGEVWKNIRMKMSPFFSPEKMKYMFESIQQCANQFEEVLDKTNGQSFDMRVLSEQYTIDAIGKCVFGINFFAMEDPNCLIRLMARRIFQFRFQTIFRPVIPKPPKFLSKMFNVSHMDHEIEEFFKTTIREAIKLRIRSPNPDLQNDLMSLLLAKNGKIDLDYTNLDQNGVFNEQYNEMPDEESTMAFIIPQCNLFFAAGYETASSTLAYVMMELAMNQSIQNKVRDEIISTVEKFDGQITYESLKEMPYTDMVLAECLRLHPPVAILARKCTKPYQIPNTEAIIPGKMYIMVSIYGLHRDPKFYEKPVEFYPEHFTEEAKNHRPSCTYIPFGEGLRSCIGERFAKMEIKLAIVSMIKNYVFEISPKMKFSLEYEYDTEIGFLTPRNGVWLKCRKISTK